LIDSLSRSARLALALALGLGAPALAACPQALHTAPLSIQTTHGEVRLTVEVADNDRTREIGLMCRKHIADDRGMLFDFKQPQEVYFWMKNTLIPLDMLFIDADGRVISIARNAIPMDDTPIPSSGPVLGVLEIGGGRAAALNVEPGDVVRERIFHR
jgi:uncharacterized membrane protein (UPF0127 family)